MKTENGYLNDYLSDIVSAIKLEPAFSDVAVFVTFPTERLVFKEQNPLIAVGFEKLEFSSAGICDFIGNTKDIDGNIFEGYGKRCNLSLVFTLHTPLNCGGEGCFLLASNLCDFLSFGGVLSPLYISCSGVSYNPQSKCYQTTVTAQVPALILYEQQSEQISNIIIRSVK